MTAIFKEKNVEVHIFFLLTLLEILVILVLTYMFFGNTVKHNLLKKG